MQYGCTKGKGQVDKYHQAIPINCPEGKRFKFCIHYIIRKSKFRTVKKWDRRATQKFEWYSVMEEIEKYHTHTVTHTQVNETAEKNENVNKN